MVSCQFDSYSLYVFSGVQLIGWVLPVILTFFSRYRDPVTHKWVAEMFLVAFSYYLFYAQLFLYILQIAMHQLQPDPFCPGVMTYGFPALPPFYVGVCIAMTLLLPVFLEFSYGVISGVSILSCIWIAPPAVLVWFSFYSWQQVALSLGIGLLVTLLFVLMYRFWLLPLLPYVLNVAPASTLGLVDTWFQTDAQQLETRRIAQILSTR